MQFLTIFLFLQHFQDCINPKNVISGFSKVYLSFVILKGLCTTLKDDMPIMPLQPGLPLNLNGLKHEKQQLWQNASQGLEGSKLSTLSNFTQDS